MSQLCAGKYKTFTALTHNFIWYWPIWQWQYNIKYCWTDQTNCNWALSWAGGLFNKTCVMIISFVNTFLIQKINRDIDQDNTCTTLIKECILSALLPHLSAAETLVLEVSKMICRGHFFCWNIWKSPQPGSQLVARTTTFPCHRQTDILFLCQWS